MSAPRLLWRLADLPHQRAYRVDTLAEGLRTHLHYADLQTTLVQINGRQQAYVALAGCAGCVHGRCAVGCRTELLRRLVQGALGLQVQFQLVRKGLARRPYRQALFLWPTGAARPIDAGLLRDVAEVRLTLHWSHRRLFRERMAVAGLLLSSFAPELPRRLQAYGWRTVPIARAQLASWVGGDHARPLPVRGAWAGEPYLLLPAQPPMLLLPPGSTANTSAEAAGERDEQATDTEPAVAEDAFALLLVATQPDGSTATDVPGHEVAESARRWLEAVRDRLPLPKAPHPDGSGADNPQPGSAPASGDNDERDPAAPSQAMHAQTAVVGGEPVPSVVAEVGAMPAQNDEASVAEAQPVAEPASAEPGVAWPAGPGQMRPDEVAHLIELCLTSPAFVSGERPGVSKKRLGAVLPVALAEHSAQLVVWLGRAGVLAEPLVPAEPWRNPRPLRSAEPAWLAAQLATTPIPTLAEAQAALRQQTL